MTADDIPTIRRWIETPHVAAWWHDPAEQFELVDSDPADPEFAQYIVVADQRPFAYLQCYNAGVWKAAFGPQPEGTRGLDQFIGELNMLDRGHGSAFVRAFAERLLANGTPRLLMDPDPANARAIRAYEKAGFSRDRVIDTPDGPALLMLRDAKERP